MENISKEKLAIIKSNWDRVEECLNQVAYWINNKLEDEVKEITGHKYYTIGVISARVETNKLGNSALCIYLGGGLGTVKELVYEGLNQVGEVIATCEKYMSDFLQWKVEEAEEELSNMIK